MGALCDLYDISIFKTQQNLKFKFTSKVDFIIRYRGEKEPPVQSLPGGSGSVLGPAPLFLTPGQSQLTDLFRPWPRNPSTSSALPPPRAHRDMHTRAPG